MERETAPGTPTDTPSGLPQITTRVIPPKINGCTPTDLLAASVELTCPCGCGQHLQLARAGDEWAIGRFDCIRSIVTWGTAEQVLSALLDDPITTEGFLAKVRSRVQAEMRRSALGESR